MDHALPESIIASMAFQTLRYLRERSKLITGWSGKQEFHVLCVVWTNFPIGVTEPLMSFICLMRVRNLRSFSILVISKRWSNCGIRTHSA